MSRYQEVYTSWKNDPEGFWRDAAEGIAWSKPADQIYARIDGLDRWYVGAECNTCYNCVDRHIEAGRGDQLAVIYDSPITGAKRNYTYNQLRDEVAALGAVLQDLGVEKGDRVIVYMPMVPEALIAMLACARIGAVHSVVFGGFAANELAVRIDDATPKAIIAGSC
ncbi:MAG: AMP-binding protein, partial [Aestuariivirgaceae bacterium]